MPPGAATLPTLYRRTLATQPGAGDWAPDAARWLPHVLVVNAGTNDLAGNDPPTGATVAQGLAAFVLATWRGYRDTGGAPPVVLLWCGPFVPVFAEQCRATAAAAAAVRAAEPAADVRVRQFVARKFTAAVGCGGHPALAAQAAIAAELVAALANVTW